MRHVRTLGIRMRNADSWLFFFLRRGALRAFGCSAGAANPAARVAFSVSGSDDPVRDGVHCRPSFSLLPTPQAAPHPFRRTPYGVPEKAPAQVPANLQKLMQDGYIFVVRICAAASSPEGYLNFFSGGPEPIPRHTNETTTLTTPSSGSSKRPNNNGKLECWRFLRCLTTALALLILILR